MTKDRIALSLPAREWRIIAVALARVETSAYRRLEDFERARELAAQLSRMSEDFIGAPMSVKHSTTAPLKTCPKCGMVNLAVRMKMHPRPVLRHLRHVAPVKVESFVNQSDLHPEPYILRFEFEASGRTTSLTMTQEECARLFEMLGVMLRFKGAAASEISTEEWIDVRRFMKRVVEG